MKQINRKNARIWIAAFFIGMISMLNGIIDLKKPSEGSFSISNIRALQASAAEAYCDQSNESQCVIVWGEIRGVSTGIARSGNP